HGYERFPQRITSDVDLMIPGDVRAEQVAALLEENRAAIGGTVVRCLSNYIVLAGRNADGSRCFLDLDLSADCIVANRHFCAGSEILKSRRRHHPFWVPGVPVEFGCYLVRKIAKGALNDEQARRLTDLYSRDPAGCRKWIDRFWAADRAAIFGAAAGSGHWDPVRRGLQGLRAELMRHALWRPWRLFGNWWSRMARRMKRMWRPEGGLNIILLGTDGAGKSSVIEAVSRNVGGVFARTTCYTFPPALLRRLLRRPEGPPKLPQELPPRSFLASVIRAVGYWFVYYRLLQKFSIRLDLARSTLVWHDRHLVDALVDAKRYRYAGPRRLLELIWRLIPKPHLVILLDAPAAVVQARKQEVPFEETARQRNAYLAIIKTLKNGHVVDAAQSLEKVVEDVSDIVLRDLNMRIREFLALEKKP
ncbi:MAG TPA: hypothetical protein VNX28_19140, partial [Gemmataceae bacterium]|nr:hypothetical protein [Gemmataceae bacterium]